MGPLRDHNERAALAGEEQAIIDRDHAIKVLEEHAEYLKDHPDAKRRLIERPFVQNTRERLVAARDEDRKNHPSMKEFRDALERDR